MDVPLAIHIGTGNAADHMLYHYLPRLRTAQTTVAFTIGNMLACNDEGQALRLYPIGP